MVTVFSLLLQRRGAYTTEVVNDGDDDDDGDEDNDEDSDGDGGSTNFVAPTFPPASSSELPIAVTGAVSVASSGDA